MGGGGDDAAYEAKQQKIEDNKQAARERLNYMFGVGDGGAARSVDKGQFTSTVPVSGQPAPSGPAMVSANSGFVPGQITTENGVEAPPPPMFQESFDQAGYDAAAAKAAAEAEASNPNKGARDQLYQTIRDNAFNSGKTRLDEAQQDAARKLKFELFAKGLNGGSEDVDENANLHRTYTGGLLDLGAKADAAKADFRQGDETTRLNLLQSIDAGMGQGTALSSAIGQMQVNSDKAAAQAMGTDLGNLFDTGKEFWNQSQYARGAQAGTGAYDLFRKNNSAGTSGIGTNATVGLINNAPVYG
jgi:hypothetical protein